MKKDLKNPKFLKVPAKLSLMEPVNVPLNTKVVEKWHYSDLHGDFWAINDIRTTGEIWMGFEN